VTLRRIAVEPINRRRLGHSEGEPVFRVLLEQAKELLAMSVAGLMGRNTLSIDWRGQIYDCDFNQQLGLDSGHQDPLFVGNRSQAAEKHADRRREPLRRLHRWIRFLM
jgi:hypothetical protein